MAVTMHRGGLRIDISVERSICLNTSAETFIAAIDEAVKNKGFHDVLEKGSEILWCKIPLLSDSLSTYDDAMEKYKKTLKKCDCGLYVNTCSSNVQKQKLLDKLFQDLEINWKVSVI